MSTSPGSRQPSGVRLADPDTFRDGVPHDAIDELRARTPVAWQEVAEQPGFWAVLRHEDLVVVARRSDLFSASLGGVLIEDLGVDQLELMRGMLLAMDPPRHTVYRQPLAETFKASIVAGLEPQIRSVCRDALAGAAERSSAEFVHDVAALIPTRVMGRLMGLPAHDWSRIHELAERQTSGQDPDLADTGGTDDSASIEMAMYAIEFASARRADQAAGAEPPADLTTLILDHDFDGNQMTEVEFASFFVQLVTAGNDTTTTLLSSGLHALLTHPDQLAIVRDDSRRIPNAVEEILRWANPLHYFRRTATTDTELGGVAITAGDKVAMYYTAANRDPAVFADPHRFDVTRTPNPHVAFGIGQHFCLGAHLARLEARVFFEELFATFPTIELAGEPVRVRSNLINGFKRLPVRLA